MVATTVLPHGELRVVDYRCDAGPHSTPFVEVHPGHSLSFVRCGSFGYRTRGKHYELVAGAVLVGYPGDEFMCTHEHHACGDECLSIQFTPALVEGCGGAAGRWLSAAVPPLPELMVLGELAQACASGASEVGLDEAALLFVQRFAELASA